MKIKNHKKQMIEVNCNQCKKQFLKRECQVKQRATHYCSTICYQTYINTVKIQKQKNIKKCLYCNQDFVAIDYRAKFCNHSCSAHFNNPLKKKDIIKIKHFHTLCDCGHLMVQSAKECLKCYHIKMIKNTGNTKICESTKYKEQKHKYQDIRNFAHTLYERNKIKKECSVCKYSYYVEICHIKPISEFDINSTYYDVNLNNTTYLCPNHHKELDGGLITVTPIKLKPF